MNRRTTPPPGPSGVRQNGFTSVITPNSVCSGMHCTQQDARIRPVVSTGAAEMTSSPAQMHHHKYHVMVHSFHKAMNEQVLDDIRSLGGNLSL